jgi:hypothetical protein
MGSDTFDLTLSGTHPNSGVPTDASKNQNDPTGTGKRRGRGRSRGRGTASRRSGERSRSPIANKVCPGCKRGFPTNSRLDRHRMRCRKDKICTISGLKNLNIFTIDSHRCRPRQPNNNIGAKENGNKTGSSTGNNNIGANENGNKTGSTTGNNENGNNDKRNNTGNKDINAGINADNSDGNNENIFNFGNDDGSFLQPEQAGPNRLDNLLDSACTHFKNFIEKQTEKTLALFGTQLNKQMTDSLEVFGFQLKKSAEDALKEFQTEQKKQK